MTSNVKDIQSRLDELNAQFAKQLAGRLDELEAAGRLLNDADDVSLPVSAVTVSP